MRSLRSRLWVLWIMAASASIGVGVLLVQLYEQSATAQIGRAEAVVAGACGAIRTRYAFYASGWDGTLASFDDPAFRRDLAAVVMVALAGTGLEGGIVHATAGPLATIGGEAPAADRAAIEEANRAADIEEQPVARTITVAGATIVLASCPMETPLPGLTAWTLTRVSVAVGFDRLRLGLALLLFLVLGMSAWLSWLILLWSRHVGGIEAALAHRGGDAVPALARTGERELDRIVDALNESGKRLAEGRRLGEALAARVAAAERMAALGRVAAGVAHEIRNPIASMQLKAENALAGDDRRRGEALSGMLGQIARLDALVGELLAFTQPREMHPRDVVLAEFLAERADEQSDAAGAAGVAVTVATDVAAARFDPDLVARVLDNLIRNAIQHAGPGEAVTISASSGAALQFEVADTGPGVQPDLVERIFDPFVTGRPDGTGLGLAIAREFAEAHGGRLILSHPGGATPGDGARFVLELPNGCEKWPSS